MAGRPVGRATALSGLRRLVGTLAVLALTFALVSLAAFLVGQRLLVTRIEAPGRVVLAGQTLRAVASGQVSFLDPTAKKGEVAFALATTGGETLSILMPCDCEGVPAGLAEGATVVAGDPVMVAVDASRQALVEASVPASQLFALQQAGGAEMRLADGTTTFGHLTRSGPQAAIADGSSVEVALTPETPFDASLAGQVVQLDIRREPSTLFDRLRGAIAPLVALWPVGA